MCYAKPGRRCSDHVALQKNTTFVRKAAAEQALADGLARKEPASIIATRQESVASWTARAAELETAWEKTEAGMRHLEEVAADDTRDDLERAAAARKASKHRAEHKQFLDSVAAAGNRDAELMRSMQEDGIPKPLRDKIAKIERDSTYEKSYEVPSKTAMKMKETAEDNVADVISKAKQDWSATKARLVTENPELTGEEITAHPDLEKVRVEGKLAIAEAKEARDEATINYYQSPEGLKELKAQRSALAAKIAKRNAEIEKIENDPAILLSPEAIALHRKVQQVANQKKLEVSAGYNARINGIKARMKKMKTQEERDAAQAQIDALEMNAERDLAGYSRESVERAVRSNLVKNAIGDQEKALQQHVSLAEMDQRIKVSTELKKRAASNKVKRVVRERAIRDAYGDNTELAEQRIKEYRRNKKLTTRRQGGRVKQDPATVKRSTTATYFTPEEMDRVNELAAAKGMKTSHYIAEKLSRSPQEAFVNAPLGQLQANVEDKTPGLRHRNRRVADAAAVSRHTLGISKASKARLDALGASFHMTRSSYSRAVVLDELDPRQVQNDRSDEHNQAKEAAMYQEHANASASSSTTENALSGR